ncbi:hypothetical protein MAHJHV61_39680 [Mycobacterium avium subsp. hominissuis]|uniref:hypothetical protein n=1 Tax=Mycobacterium avium TaxID=1764 RepID=UPI0011500508|nr:hypothetical protein [Mycobacterium avium]
MASAHRLALRATRCGNKRLFQFSEAMTTGGCAPSGCQCFCHRPGIGMFVSHVVPCCSGEFDVEVDDYQQAIAAASGEVEIRNDLEFGVVYTGDGDRVYEKPCRKNGMSDGWHTRS